MKTLPTQEQLISFIENQDFAFCTNGGRSVVCDFDSVATEEREELVKMVEGAEIKEDEAMRAEFNHEDDKDCTIISCGAELWIAYYC